MALSPRIVCSVTITAVDIKGNSVAKIFSSVTNLNFDFFKGMVNIVDDVQGDFFFSLIAISALTYTVNGTVTTVVMS